SPSWRKVQKSSPKTVFLSKLPTKAGLSLNISDSCPSMCKCSPEDIIHCSRAGLRALPEEIAASTISLNLSNNYLRILTTNTFRNLTSLHSLWLDGNNLTFLSPGTFHTLSKLQELHLSRNSRLTYLHDLETLHDLNLRKNHIWIIQNGAFTKLLRLSMLNLGHNFIADLPNQLFDGLIQLKTMHLEANRITAVNCTFRHLLSLRNLYLNNNQISSISDSAFSYLNKLHFLHLSKNNLSSLPIHLFTELPKLKYVFLSHNPWKCDCRMRWFCKTFYHSAAPHSIKPQLTWLCIYPCKELIYLGDGLYELCLPACC
uniref:LRRNT domain-containing protein n=1 Tax=Bubo bubo TaxID=30461 RepID=A0A8C0ECH2_BUBBB